MLQKYIIPVKMNNGTTYYAYRTFTTDLTDKATVTVPAGATVDFTQFFDVSAGATVTGNFLNGAESAAIKAVPVTGTVGDTYAGTITLTDGTVLSNFTVKVEQGVLVAGYYHIYWQKSTTESTTKTPIFIGYNTDNYDNNIEGYKMLAEGQYTTDASADKVFALIPKGNGFALSAQGKYLQSPIFNEWKHIMFSDEESKAGVYVFTANNGAYTIKGLGGTDGQKNHLQVYDNNDQGKYAVGNNVEGSAHQFTLTPVTTYEIAEGMTALCLPFNVILPTDVVAYDVVNATEETLKSPKNLFVKLATGGDILLAGTPVILKANAATSLTITMNSERGKTSSNGSLLRGNFVKQTLKIEATKKYILQGGEFIAVTPGNNIISANSCWVVTDIPDENASLEQDHIVIDGWEFKYTEKAEGRITLGDCIKEGNPTLNIGSEYVVNGEKKTVAAISRDFLEGNTTLQSITLPATMTNLGFRETELMFEGGYAGESGDGATYDGNQLVGTAVGLNRCYKFPDDPTTGEPYVVGKETAWKLTLDVTIDPTKKTSYNNYGSAIVSTKQNSLDDNYQGYMQIYMWQDLQHIVVRIDNADDRYAYSTPALDEQGNETSELLVMNSFRFELEHDGSGGYQVVIYYPNGKAKMYNITATQNNIVNNFDRLYYSLPEGISVKVKFEKLTTHGLFVGCTNLTDINVDPANPTFKSCKHGVLYDKNGYYVMRIPEGGTDRYEIPSKVVKLYPGAVHGVKANVVLHSNPEIGVVKGHEEEIKNVNFELSLDDIDPERSEGGAYDFNTSNLNTYKSARYRRAPLAEGAYGTITLPFASTNMMDKYDFYQFVGGSDEALHFTQVETLEANTPYLYKLKEGVDATTVTDVFETAYPFTIVYKDKYYPNEAPGTYNAVGTYTNFYVETNQAATSKSAYYYYSIGSKAFLKVTQKLNYRPYRAFFVVTPANGLAAQAPATLSLRLLDGSTEVIAPSQVEGWEENIYYDLMGRRVMNPTNGIYIVNGKKVIF